MTIKEFTQNSGQLHGVFSVRRGQSKYRVCRNGKLFQVISGKGKNFYKPEEFFERFNSWKLEHNWSVEQMILEHSENHIDFYFMANNTRVICLYIGHSNYILRCIYTFAEMTLNRESLIQLFGKNFIGLQQEDYIREGIKINWENQ